MHSSRKYLKIALIFLLLIIGIVAILSMVAPVSQKIRRSIIIKAPPSAIYDKLVKLENFNKWAVWSLHDSLSRPVINGTDGTVGASETWNDNEQISGEVEIRIDSLLPKDRIVHSIHFIKPRKANARSAFILQQIKEGTLLTWELELTTPRPRNIFNMFYSLDKTMGKDFEDGLSLIKTAFDPVATTKKYEPLPMNFPATDFVLIRQEVRASDIPSFLEQHFGLIGEEIKKLHLEVGQTHGFFYGWDEKKEVADLGAAISVPAGTTIDNPVMQVIHLPASKAIIVDYQGPYSGLPEVQNEMNKYLASNKLIKKEPVIQTYIKGPPDEKDESKWKTRVIFLVE